MLEKSNSLSTTKVLVYGWYHKNNLGDDLFIEAFQHLFPEFEFTFTDRLIKTAVLSASAVIFGGGSFLLGMPDISSDAAGVLCQKKIYYLGVGVETDIHPFHESLMKQAQLIAIRTPDQLERVKKINPHTIYVPDLVYSLPSTSLLPRQSKKILIVPNATLIPSWDDAHWKHTAWNYFKSEFCQFLDYLVEQDYQLRFFAMCCNQQVSDVRASQEIISGMKYRNDYLIDRPITDFGSVTDLFTQCGSVITQRFHGIVLSEVTKTPYLAIHHHDKLKNSCVAEAESLSYYGFNKDSLIKHFNRAKKMKYSSLLPIETNIFEELRKSVLNSISDMVVSNGALCRNKT